MSAPRTTRIANTEWPLPAAWTLRAVVGTTGFVCAAFTAVAATTLLITLPFETPRESMAFFVRLGVKAFAFTLMASAFAWDLWRLRARAPQFDSESPAEPTPHAWAWLALVLAIGALLAFPRLGAYPLAEPDETYHLVVARNLAQYGLYASGHPDTGFVMFDSYDSVGPPVLLPIAGAFRVLGVELIVARTVMAFFCLAFIAAVYFFLRPVFGGRSAAAAALLSTLAEGSIYLGRTLYGEIPALLFGLLGLIAWRRAMANRTAVYGLLAGLCFGVAILCKSIFVLAAWACIAACIYDRLTARRVRFAHLAWPVVGTALPIVAWWLVKKVYKHDVADTASGALAMYKHYLMFGFGGVDETLTWAVHQPATALSLLVVLVLALPFVFERRPDPALMAFYFLAPFFVYWWVFFTPGNIPRYIWYSNVTGAALSSAVLAFALHRLFSRNARRMQRAVGLLVTLVVLGPALMRAESQGRRIAFSDEMAEYRALAARLQTLPPDARVGTNAWPIERAMNFMTGRYVARTRADKNNMGNLDALVINMSLVSLDTPDPPDVHRERIGPSLTLFTRQEKK